MIKLFVFDMAGTCVDEDNLVYKTIRKAIEEAGHEVSLETVLEFAAGKEKLKAITDVLIHLYGTADEVQAKEIFEDFRAKLKVAYDVEPIKPIKDVEHVFEKLREKGIKIALNTGYDRATAEKLMAKLDWTIPATVDHLVTASDVEVGRPMPDMIWKAMAMAGISEPEEVAKIGDSAIDIEEGHNAGCGLVLGITTGAQTTEQLAKAKPHQILDAAIDILNLI
ncbi:MAG: phosphonatase-like hydrolase [Bacteroidota bacterium]